MSEVIDTAEMADGSVFSLRRQGDDWMVYVNGRTLMSSRVFDSEEALADETFDRVPDAQEVLVGGLGLGFTLRAVLDRASSETKVVVAELVPSLVGWNHSYVGELTDHPLDDPRSEVVLGNVLDEIRRSSRRFDAIILDVDNGPVALSSERNNQLYSPAGVRACHKALCPDGVLSVWSAAESPRFERTLRAANFAVEIVRVRARKASSARHVLFIARRIASGNARRR